jgi:hypothetical protein
MFGWASRWKHFPLLLGFAFSGDLLTALDAFRALAVECLSDRRGAAQVAEAEDFDFELAAVVGDT